MGFLRTSPSTSDLKYPATDHTLGEADGHFIEVNGDATLTYTIPTTVADNVQPMCLKFWYCMASAPDGSLTKDYYFNISTTRADSLDGITGATIKAFNNQNQWLYRRVSFTLDVNETIGIRAHVPDTSSVLAFDDIQIQNEFCERPGWCDFENGIKLIVFISLIIFTICL